MSAGYRKPLVALALLGLAAGLWTGLQRIGWDLPSPRATFSMLHGPLMVGGFIGTLICLERAVALGRWWGYAGPMTTGVGSILLLVGVTDLRAPALILIGSSVLAAAFVVFIRRQRALAMDVMALGVFTWWTGNVLWLVGRPLYDVVHFWTAFLVLTIAGERLELGRLRRLTSDSRAIFLAGIGAIVVGLPLLIHFPATAVRLTGAGMVVLAYWLLRYDIARQTVRTPGLPRFIAVSLLAGYAWLAAGGLMSVWYGYQLAGPYYDAIVHTIMVGFVLSMIMGHAPVVFPAVLGVRMKFSPLFYIHIALLHASLDLRVAGDILLSAPMRQWGAMLNVAAIVLFFANTVVSVIRGQREKTTQ